MSAPDPSNDLVKEMREFSKEFHHSLSIDQESESKKAIKENKKSSEKSSCLSVESTAKNSSNDTSNTTSSNNKKNGKDNQQCKRFVAPKDFELLKVIGMGSFGKVLQVRNRHSSQILAMKVISKRLLKRKVSYVENVLAERNILTKIANHPFIVTMHCSFQTREKLFIIMDFCAGGELFLKLGREGIFMERTAAFYLAEITLALEHLHSVNVLHRDLKPENILLGSDGHCRLTDFGLAKDFTEKNRDDNDEVDERARTLCGTMEYMAPEMVARKWYGKGADFWSLGCIAYEMLAGQPPFSSKKGSKDLFRKIMEERIRMPDGASASACKLLKGMLNRDANKRLGAARGTMFEIGGVGALKKQPFFDGLDWGKLELKEIDPPEDFSVDNDEDLRHFHDEFTKMTLPRSVKEMSKHDFLPRHCDSENFRGFSFIGENFPLPERSASEQEHYWNNVDDDGQSLSECASSVFDDDYQKAMDVPEPTPEKKKRPPRKKKKKQTVPLETTDEANEPNEPAVENEGDETKRVVEDMAIKVVVDDEVAKKVEDKKDSTDENGAMNSILETSRPKQIVVSLPKPPQSSVPVANGDAVKASRSLNPNVSAWSFAPAKAVAQPNGPIQNTAQSKIPTQPKPVVQPTYKPAPGSWASMAVSKGKSSSTPQKPMQSIPPNSITTSQHNLSIKPNAVNSALPPPSPRSTTPLSPDWRNHVVSPRRLSSNVIPPPNDSQLNAAMNAWPSLGDFPPPPGSKKEAPKQSVPKGVWGKR
mmetsp:Transcript_31230/g.64944  ORF Transcript_31230/g.64944 Transcript_31230/m.64944 type:complete len:761 (-) Transcript_31230:99-2381(-)